MSLVDLDDRGRLTLPKEIRTAMSLEKVVVINAGDHLVLIPVPDDPFKALKGVISSDKSFQDLREEATRLAAEEALHGAS